MNSRIPIVGCASRFNSNSWLRPNLLYSGQQLCFSMLARIAFGDREGYKRSSPRLSALLRSEGLLSIDCRTGETAGIFRKFCIACSPVLLKIPTDSPTHRTSGHRACPSYERHFGPRTFKEKRSRSAARRCYVPEPWRVLH